MNRVLATAILAFVCTPALADGFMATHMENQKVGSPVVTYWKTQAALAQPDNVAPPISSSSRNPASKNRPECIER
jgi:hypothetical protein